MDVPSAAGASVDGDVTKRRIGRRGAESLDRVAEERSHYHAFSRRAGLEFGDFEIETAGREQRDRGVGGYEGGGVDGGDGR